MQKQIEFDENHDIEHIKTTERKNKEKQKKQNSMFSFVGFVCSSIQISRPAHEADEAMDCVEEQKLISTEQNINSTFMIIVSLETSVIRNIYEFAFTYYTYLRFYYYLLE